MNSLVRQTSAVVLITALCRNPRRDVRLRLCNGMPFVFFSEDDGLVAVSNDAVLAVPQDGARQHGAFDVGAKVYQIADAVTVIHPHDGPAR
jgi:hypothetical protein